MPRTTRLCTAEEMVGIIKKLFRIHITFKQFNQTIMTVRSGGHNSKWRKAMTTKTD